jgi:hypothetical protein
VDDVRKSYAWQEAMALAVELVRVCEEFSDANNNVLVGHLRQAVVDIPSTIAADLKFGRNASMDPVIKLGTELELVHRIYPAIDTGEAPNMLARLIERMSSERFAEREPEESDDEGGVGSPEMMSSQDGSAQQGLQPAGGTALGPQVDHVTGPRIINVSGNGHGYHPQREYPNDQSHEG